MIRRISSICVALIILFGINCKGICGNEDSETDKDNKPTEYGRKGIDKLEVDSSALLDNAERPDKTSCKDLKRVEARDEEEYGSYYERGMDDSLYERAFDYEYDIYNTYDERYMIERNEYCNCCTIL